MNVKSMCKLRILYLVRKSRVERLEQNQQIQILVRRVSRIIQNTMEKGLKVFRANSRIFYRRSEVG